MVAMTASAAHPPKRDHPAPHVGAAAYLPLMRSLVHGLRRRLGVTTGDHLAVACSGGADSVALLRGLHLLAPRRGWRLRLTVLHVQHHLRGAAAEDDASFVAALAGSLDLPYLRQDIDPGPLPGNLEANARRLRYAALTTAARTCGATHLATAHPAADQLETLLMALLRGTTAAGLRGIAWQRPLADDVQLIRPILAADRQQVRQFLQHLGQTWQEDHTNRDPTRTRARLRRDVIPHLRDLRPDVASKALQLSDHLRQLVGSSQSADPVSDSVSDDLFSDDSASEDASSEGSASERPPSEA